MLKNDLILAIKSPPGWGIRKIFSPGGGDFSEKILPHPRGFQPSPGGGGWVSKRIEASITLKTSVIRELYILSESNIHNFIELLH